MVQWRLRHDKKSAEAKPLRFQTSERYGVHFSELLLILVLLDNASLDQLVNQLLH